MLQQYKIVTLAPTCFGSRRNRHQRADLRLAKTTEYGFCARRYRRSQSYGGISAIYAAVTLTASIPTSSTGLLPDDGSCVKRNMSERVS